jgi:hypothetical protein
VVNVRGELGVDHQHCQHGACREGQRPQAGAADQPSASASV